MPVAWRRQLILERLASATLPIHTSPLQVEKAMRPSLKNARAPTRIQAL